MQRYLQHNRVKFVFSFVSVAGRRWAPQILGGGYTHHKGGERAHYSHPQCVLYACPQTQLTLGSCASQLLWCTALIVVHMCKICTERLVSYWKWVFVLSSNPFIVNVYGHMEKDRAGKGSRRKKIIKTLNPEVFLIWIADAFVASVCQHHDDEPSSLACRLLAVIIW